MVEQIFFDEGDNGWQCQSRKLGPSQVTF
jgi:hypothetical protein